MIISLSLRRTYWVEREREMPFSLDPFPSLQIHFDLQTHDTLPLDTVKQ